MFLVRLGHVRVSLGFHGEESKVISCGPGAVLGEIGLLAFASEDLAKSADALDQELQQALQAAGSQLAESFPAGVRSATCTALGLVELARLNRGDFLEMLARFSALRKSLVQISLGRMKATAIGDPFVTEFIAQGLYEGRSVLTLDLDLCTRCDECTKGCVEQHGTHSHGTPITRLLRDGKRYDKFLVATSCRSCTDAHCMVGCPVDAIHRGRHQQIVIEDHCIGCGLCATNCPYGSIFMVPNQHRKIEVSDPSRPGHSIKVPQLRAAACDLCDAEGEKSTPEPRCVSACPHDAAHRMSGDELLALVTAKHKPLG
jgi:Fe-S-cluster-containing hydrogenase component 2